MLVVPRAANAQSPAPATAALPSPISAASSSPAIALPDAIVRLFTAATIAPDWFAPSFLASVPIDQVRGIVASVHATLGAYASIAPSPHGFAVAFATGSVQAQGALDANGAFTGLQISAMQTPLIAQRLRALFGPDPAPAAWFGDQFLATYPIDRVHTIIATIKGQAGPLLDVLPQPDGTYDLSFVNAHVAGLAFLGPDGRFEVLRFQPK